MRSRGGVYPEGKGQLDEQITHVLYIDKASKQDRDGEENGLEGQSGP